ncbi:efflux RND transporter periplasmic adaptor subunit [Altericroceibacterium endophyticum]|uniref:Efflux RND transporter periplasmic adaptor subunit n=1 Tax=Altericroceibacterium endophyticum TaxID=1808508 RepID=A0A6I4T0P5_9SPHN|nr:efflux RND transporter periplasmic adaptor subunit [Altericroceibacterium endophyticum]MXO64498.1 efflux RND transporter periplasmic adaptor subunit [Altericroceibacterium endophyticum]
MARISTGSVQRMMGNKLAAVAASLALVLGACSSGGDDAAPPPPTVTVAQPVVQELVDWDEYVGRFEAVREVDVRPRATGYLSSAKFTDGQYVRKGQLLFTVDPRPARAALAQARAQLAQAEANLANARTELARSETLAAARAASQEELESRNAAVRSGEAQVAAARSLVRARELDVGFTRITAPISGRISERRVDPGNTVTADQTILTTIVSTNPLHFKFRGSEALLLKYQREGSGTVKGTQVRVRLPDETEFLHTGKLDFIDNAIDAGAGTIQARAVIPNPDGFLKAGMTGNLRLEASTPYQAMLVPDVAIVSDGARRVVYVVGKDGTVAARPVQTGPLSKGLRVIRSGLKPKESVIISGVQRARPGQKVTPKAGKIEAQDGADGEVADTPPASAVALPVGQ